MIASHRKPRRFDQRPPLVHSLTIHFVASIPIFLLLHFASVALGRSVIQGAPTGYRSFSFFFFFPRNSIAQASKIPFSDTARHRTKQASTHASDYGLIQHHNNETIG